VHLVGASILEYEGRSLSSAQNSLCVVYVLNKNNHVESLVVPKCVLAVTFYMT